MKKKLFDYVIGNPPYQEEVENNGRSNPVYNLFMDASYEVADKVELITPARFLFNAGQTPKAWNKKMLADKHFKVLQYEPDGAKIFSNTDIKGGVCISYRDSQRNFEPIELFCAFPELNSIFVKVRSISNNYLDEVIVGAVPYRFSETLRNEHPELVDLIGSSFDLRTNILDKLADKIMFDHIPDSNSDWVGIVGLHNKKRSTMYIEHKYILCPENFEHYKVLVPKSNGSGALGEVLSTPVIGQPVIGHTQSFISIGNLSFENEANALLKYVKSKFARVMLGILKVTQENSKDTWRFVPMQDFTPSSDIDWSQSVHEIDLQLYRKYGLDEKEIDFIETHVKEME